jgi:hypothetical protein
MADIGNGRLFQPNRFAIAGRAGAGAPFMIPISGRVRRRLCASPGIGYHI